MLRFRRILLFGVYLFGRTSSDAAAATNTTSPPPPTNILVLLTDDQDIALGSFDTARYMPQVHEKLQRSGISFEQGALVHVPICCPNRASILTGKYLHHGQLAFNNSISGNCYSQAWKSTEENHHTLAVHAHAAGYTTLYAGKYLNQYKHTTHSDDNTTISKESIPKGWDYWYGLEGNSRYYNYTIVERRPNTKKEDGDDDDDATILLHEHGDSYPDDYLPLVLEDYTLKTLAQLPEPWLAVVAWPTPHGPFTPEPQYAKAYPRVEPPKGGSYNASDASQQQKHWLLRQLGLLSNRTAHQIESIYKDRLRALKTVDNHVGKLVDWLERTSTSTTTTTRRHGTTAKRSPSTPQELRSSIQRNLVGSNHSSKVPQPEEPHQQHQEEPNQAMIDRTMIIYTSDNGFQFGQHRLSIDKRHLYEHDVRVPFVVRPPKTAVPLQEPFVTVSKETIVSTLDIAPTVLEIVMEGIQQGTTAAATTTPSNDNGNTGTDKNANGDTDTEYDQAATVHRLRTAMEGMDGLSFWRFLKGLGNDKKTKHSGNDKNIKDDEDPFEQRTDLLISYHGEGDPKCGLSQCPAPLDGLWWMPDSYNNTYHCVRTLRAGTPSELKKDQKDSHSDIHSDADRKALAAEDSIYCVFYDDEDFVEYYNLLENPHQLGNDYKSLTVTAMEDYERRLQELLS